MIRTSKWGPVDRQIVLADGVHVVSASGHGGFVLSSERNQIVPAPARRADGCYEEDCDWSIAWIALRSAGILADTLSIDGQTAQDIDKRARRTLDRWHPDLVTALTGEAPDPDNPILLQRQDIQEARSKSWVMAVSVTAASPVNAVPEGMVGAILAPPHEKEYRPDRSRDFYALIDAEIYSESRLNSGLHLFCEDELIRIPYDPWMAACEDILAPEEAYAIASQWGSLVSSGDPGAIFYTFPVDDARPQNSEHRKALVEYTRQCKLIAEERVADFDAASPEEQEGWAWGDPHKDRDDLIRLEAFFLLSERLPDLSLEGPEI